MQKDFGLLILKLHSFATKSIIKYYDNPRNYNLSIFYSLESSHSKASSIESFYNCKTSFVPVQIYPIFNMPIF